MLRLTEAEFSRLPAVLKPIVETDRQIEELQRRPAVPMFDFKRLRDERRFLQRSAERVFAPQIKGSDNTKGTS